MNSENLRAEPMWERRALFALLGATAILYIWGLGASGYANDFYSAAVQAGTHSLKAAFFGASDAAGSITVDKSPLFLWPMELSARIFGVNSWSILVPQAVEGVAAVGVLYAAVKRWAGAGAGLVAGAVLALTPVATLMFRFNNPDAMLTLLLTCAGYAMIRALEHDRTRWVVTCFALVGLGFLAKMLQAFVVVPPLGFAYLLAGPPKLGRRVSQLAIGAVAMVIAAGWWVAIVELWPKSSRPYIGGSQNNSVLNLILGYNGFGRLTGNETGSVGGRPTATGGYMWGKTGLFRMFRSNFGGEASWLIPTALLLGVVVLVATFNRHRTDRTRAALIVWGGWLLTTGLTFSFGQGIIHPYYTVALAPGIGGTVAVAGAYLWQRCAAWWARLSLAVSVLTAALWSARLLHRTPLWNSWLTPVILVAAAAAIGLLLLGNALGPKVMTTAAVAAVSVGLLGSAAYSFSTANQPHAGAIPSAGPRHVTGLGPSGMRRPNGFGAPPPKNPAAPPALNLAAPPTPGPGVRAVHRFGPTVGPPASSPIGGLLHGSRPTKQLAQYLLQNAKAYKWIAATVGSNEAAGYQLATDKSVMSLGGFNGTDPSPTLRQFQDWVEAHKIHYFISTGRGLGGFGNHSVGAQNDSSQTIRAWITSVFTSTHVDGVTVFDLASPLSTASDF